MPDHYEAYVPNEPEGLSIVIDKDGDAWQRVLNPENSFSYVWRCTRSKIAGQFFGTNTATWRKLVLEFGPLDPVRWT